MELILSDKMVVCSWIRKCANYEKECHHCEWNADNNIGDYLVLIDSDGKQIKFLEISK